MSLLTHLNTHFCQAHLQLKLSLAETFDPATGLPTQPLLHEEFKYFLEVAQTNFKVACKRKLDQITYYELTESQAMLSFDNYFWIVQGVPQYCFHFYLLNFSAS